ncbi:hypothetical protein Bbelb_068290 [Branchiostoma belcheri]|nr:hypothetical protein Bbelb_068290 [Branchiostoma belcheri]
MFLIPCSRGRNRAGFDRVPTDFPTPSNAYNSPQAPTNDTGTTSDRFYDKSQASINLENTSRISPPHTMVHFLRLCFSSRTADSTRARNNYQHGRRFLKSSAVLKIVSRRGKTEQKK